MSRGPRCSASGRGPSPYLFYDEGKQGIAHIIVPEQGLAGPGDLVIGGDSHSCTSRETAPDGLKAFGIGAIIAPTFARIFLRNAVNIGLPVLECPAAASDIREGDLVVVDVTSGLINYAKKRLGLAWFPPPRFAESGSGSV